MPLKFPWSWRHDHVLFLLFCFFLNVPCSKVGSVLIKIPSLISIYYLFSVRTNENSHLKRRPTINWIMKRDLKFYNNFMDRN